MEHRTAWHRITWHGVSQLRVVLHDIVDNMIRNTYGVSDVLMQ